MKEGALTRANTTISPSIVKQRMFVVGGGSVVTSDVPVKFALGKPARVPKQSE